MSLHTQKISIEHKYRGSVVLPENSEAKSVFFRTKQAYANIFLAANPDSLYLKRAEWEANLYDHGKNVADDVLLQNFQDANLTNANVFILTFDRELKERFTEVTHKSNNLYIMGK